MTRSYRTLRDPVSRGIYWLELNGKKLNQHNNRVRPELAELVFAVQEQLAELRAARSDGSAEVGELATGIAQKRSEIAGLIDETVSELLRNFERWDANSEGDDGTVLGEELKAILSRIAYLRTLIRDVDRELEDAKAA